VTTPLLSVAEPTPEAAGFGLYSAAVVVDSEDPHAQSGVTWELSSCGVAGAFPIACPADYTLDVRQGLDYVEAPPFGVNAGLECKPVGTPLDQLRDLVATRLRLSEQWAVERTYWTGDVLPDGAPRLAAGGDVTVLAGAPVKPAVGIGLLEEAIGNMTGAVGVIHAPRVAIGALGGHVSEARGALRTKLATRVAFGTGYPGTGPAGEARTNGSTWLFATGPVQVVRSPVMHIPNDPRDALDRETNDARLQAVRIVSVGHACGLVAVPIDLTA
jgi:hypothetical protein